MSCCRWSGKPAPREGINDQPQIETQGPQEEERHLNHVLMVTRSRSTLPATSILWSNHHLISPTFLFFHFIYFLSILLCQLLFFMFYCFWSKFCGCVWQRRRKDMKNCQVDEKVKSYLLFGRGTHIFLILISKTDGRWEFLTSFQYPASSASCSILPILNAKRRKLYSSTNFMFRTQTKMDETYNGSISDWEFNG